MTGDGPSVSALLRPDPGTTLKWVPGDDNPRVDRKFHLARETRKKRQVGICHVFGGAVVGENVRDFLFCHFNLIFCSVAGE